MTQREIPRWISESPRIYTALDEQAFQRIHLDSWSQLKWYVEFAGGNLRTLSPGALTDIYSDITAIHRAFYGHLSRCSLSLDQLVDTQSSVQDHLNALVNTGCTYFPDFVVHTLIQRCDKFCQVTPPSTRQQIIDFLQAAEGPSIEVIESPARTTARTARRVGPTTSLRYLVPDPMQAFFFHFAILLGEFGERVKRCGRTECQKVFLQERKNARFCSRKCQSVTTSAQYRAGKRKRTKKAKQRTVKRVKAKRRRS